MEPVPKLPGVTFHVQRSALREKAGEVTLDATVEDPDLWEKVLKKLDGYRVYTVSDLQTALVEVLQEEAKDEKTAHARELAAVREELERTKQELSVLKSRHSEQGGPLCPGVEESLRAPVLEQTHIIARTPRWPPWSPWPSCHRETN